MSPGGPEVNEKPAQHTAAAGAAMPPPQADAAANGAPPQGSVDASWTEAIDMVTALWPDMNERLGARAQAFRSAAVRQAQLRGLVSREAFARYLGICFVFGPAFEERPENEWALAVLADDRLQEWARLHQLMRRALSELGRRNGPADQLMRADAALLDRLDATRPRRIGTMPLGRQACDVEAIDIRVTDAPWRLRYERAERGYAQARMPLPEPLRIDADHPAPEEFDMLARLPGVEPAAMLQLRQLMHARCSDHHPRLRFIDAEGLTDWQGHEAGAVGIAVHTIAQQDPSPGFPAVLLAETSPVTHLVETTSCGLRDDGVPRGDVRMRVHAYPADQWLFTLQRQVSAAQSWPRDASGPSAWQTVATRCSVERDGKRMDGSAWEKAFDVQLSVVLQQGFDRLFEAWSSSASQAAMTVVPGLPAGKCAMTWGWSDGPGKLAQPLAMRVLADVDMSCSLDIGMSGEIANGGVRAQVRLAARGVEPFERHVDRETAGKPLFDALFPLVARLRFPFGIDADPVASEDGSLITRCGPCTGAITGEVGLRPRQMGGGWQWYVRLAAEPLTVQVQMRDPVLGETSRQLALLPAMQLVDWSAG